MIDAAFAIILWVAGVPVPEESLNPFLRQHPPSTAEMAVTQHADG